MLVDLVIHKKTPLYNSAADFMMHVMNIIANTLR
jgi:hypothetical protein